MTTPSSNRVDKGLHSPVRPKMRILVVEDEQKTAALLTSALQREDCDVTCVGDGESGLHEALTGVFDALVVDIMLPKRDGLSLVRAMRTQGRTCPVIMLSARGEVEQRVEGLDAGADDYLPKPFAMSELLARLRSLMRRNMVLRPMAISLADLVFDTATREAKRAGKRIDLSIRESLLLECLLAAEGRVVSRRDIIGTVWQYDFDPGTNLVEVYIRRLREKVDRPHSNPLIQTVRGLGYAMRLQP